MTNTKFRKRALLSSVAMLLVAMLALGSATFAWFVSNPTVSASGISANVTSEPGLYALSEYSRLANATDPTSSYGYEVELGSTGALAGIALKPASPYVGANLNTTENTLGLALPFGTISAAGASASARNTDLTFSDATATTLTYASATSTYSVTAGDVFYEDIYFKKSGTAGSALTIQSASVAIGTPTADTNDINKAVRVALVGYNPSAEAGSKYFLIGIWKPSGAADNQTWAGATDNAAITTGTAYACKTSGTTSGTFAISVANENATESNLANCPTIRVFVYLDGEDTNCKSDNALALKNLVSSIKVSVSTNSSTTAVIG